MFKKSTSVFCDGYSASSPVFLKKINGYFLVQGTKMAASSGLDDDRRSRLGVTEKPSTLFISNPFWTTFETQNVLLSFYQHHYL